MARTSLFILVAMLLAACGGQPQQPIGSIATTQPAALSTTSPQAAETSTPFAPTEPPLNPTATAPGEAADKPVSLVVQEYPVPAGSRPHDVAPAPDGSVWYTAQGSGELGRLDPDSGETHHIPLGSGSAPHGVIVGPDGAAWITDSGLNAIVRVDPQTEAVQVYPLPADRGYANLNTAAFDGQGRLWFTGQSGIYGRLDPGTGAMEVFDAPRGSGPYGITGTPDGSIYYASLANSYIARIDLQTGMPTVLDPPTPGQGARRVWSDSRGRIWVSEWNAGQVAVYDPLNDAWREWKLPGDRPRAYAVYVDDQDIVWLSDFGANALVSFDPDQETFTVFPLPSPNAQVRQILGRPGEVWGAESGVDKLVVIRSDSLRTGTAQEETASPAPDCSSPATPTPLMTEGPYYSPGSPERTTLLEADTPGTRLLLSGYVLTTDCQPVANAWLDFWQTDGNGEYDNSGYKLRGHQFTDENGRYSLETVVPGLYPGRTAHIHVKVQAPDGAILTTQLFFPGVSGNETDSIFSEELLVAMQDGEGGKLATFNFKLDVP